MSDPDVEMFDRNLMKALVADNDKLRGEIEWLKAALQSAQEIERLKAAIRPLFDVDNAPLVMSDAHSAKLMADLRAALEGKP